LPCGAANEVTAVRFFIFACLVDSVFLTRVYNQGAIFEIFSDHSLHLNVIASHLLGFRVAAEIYDP
jgi:hypothetical protein